jgi:LCP family protein required for cell wall assembly
VYDDVLNLKICMTRYYWLFLLLCLVLFSGCGDDAAAVSPAATITAVSTPRPSNTATAEPPSPPTATPGPTPTIDPVAPLTHTMNILVLGSDRRPDTTNWRTDVIMIVALDFEHQRAGIISLPRDIYVDRAQGYTAYKINTIDYVGEQKEQDGGPKLLMSILQERTGIPLHHFVRFEFDTFKQVVDALGGVDVQVDCWYVDYVADEDVHLDLKPGNYHFNGSEAISYVRTRLNNNDLDRARRQQQMIWAIRSKLTEANWLTKIPALYSSVSSSLTTDIGLIDIVRLARFGFSLQSENIHGMVVQPPTIREGWREGMFVFIPDWKGIAQESNRVFERPSFSTHATNATASVASEAVTCPSP